MPLVSNLQFLCAERNTSIPKMEKDLGFGRGSVYKWDTNSPSGDKLLRVSEYLGVTIDALYGKNSTNVNIDLTSLPNETQLEIAKIILAEPSMAEVIKKLNELPPEKRDSILNLIKAI